MQVINKQDVRERKKKGCTLRPRRGQMQRNAVTRILHGVRVEAELAMK